MQSRTSFPSRHSQRGVTLVIAMLFLVIVSLFAVSSFNSSTTNLRITGNMIARQEAVAAAQSVIEETISNTLFSTNPTAVAAGNYSVDLDGDGVADYYPRFSPAPFCQRARALKAMELDPSDLGDLACMTSGVVAHSGLDTPDLAGTAGDSLCANTEWNLRVQVNDDRTGTRVGVTQGIGVRVLAAEAADFCL
jgi:hypothetical protein